METTTLKLQAPWNNVKEKMKENDITLTDEDLNYSPGHENELLEHLSKKCRKTNKRSKIISKVFQRISTRHLRFHAMTRGLQRRNNSLHCDT